MLALVESKENAGRRTATRESPVAFRLFFCQSEQRTKSETVAVVICPHRCSSAQTISAVRAALGDRETGVYGCGERQLPGRYQRRFPSLVDIPDVVGFSE